MRWSVSPRRERHRSAWRPRATRSSSCPAPCWAHRESACQVLEDGGLPLGLQVLGFPQGDADVFAGARWIEDALHG